MAGSPREWLMIVKESAYLTPKATPVTWNTSSTYGLANADAYYIRLDGGNQFSMRPRPTGIVNVPYGGGSDIPAYMVSDKIECKGQLTCKLSVAQAPFLLSWLCQRVVGGTVPWTTTVPVGDLASCSLYHAIMRPDGSIQRRVYLGGKCDSGTATITESSTVCTLQLNISASTPQGNQFDSSSDPTSTVFPAPVDNEFAVDPFVFLHAGGSSFVTYGGAVRSQFTDLTLTVTNELARRWFANRFVQVLSFVGRKSSVACKLLYPLAAQNDRAAYEGLVSNTCSIELNNGTHGVTANFNAQNVLTPFEDDLALNDLYFQSSTSNNQWDPVAGADFTLAFT
jgi:hypothetical protein